jgi:hypothetical protein
LVSDTPPLWKGLEPEQRKDYKKRHSSDRREEKRGETLITCEKY